MRGPDRQQAIYLAGVSGRRPRIPPDAEALEAPARKAMPEEAFAYIAGAAGTGRTMRANRDGFDAWQIVPRMLRDVSERDTSVELFGHTLGVAVRALADRSAGDGPRARPTWRWRAPPAGRGSR